MECFLVNRVLLLGFLPLFYGIDNLLFQFAFLIKNLIMKQATLIISAVFFVAFNCSAQQGGPVTRRQ
jgi:hypothetical protein